MKLLSSLFFGGASVLVLSTTTVAQSVMSVDYDLGMDDGEITPDGKYGVVRMNGWEGAIRVYGMDTGALLDTHLCNPINSANVSGPNQDGVALTNERCIVIGNCTLIGDLGALGTPNFIIGHHDIGNWARDVALTPDGQLAAVRGGFDAPSNTGGLFVFDMQTGGLVATAPGMPSDPFATQYSWDLDSVAATDTHAVFLSLATSTPPTTRVTVMGLRQSPGGVTNVVYETSAAAGPDQDLVGAPSDLVLIGDGSRVAVRSEFEVAVFELNGAQSTALWRKAPQASPGPLGNATMDTIAANGHRIATITRWSNGGIGAQLDLFDFAGNQVSSRFVGDPHDLAFTPSGERLVVRTSSGAELFDANTDPSLGTLASLASKSASAVFTGWSAGLDSVELTDTHAVMLFRQNSYTEVHVENIEQDTFASEGVFDTNEEATDLRLTPDGTRAIVSADTSLLVIDLRSQAVALNHDLVGAGPFPWSDGVATDNDHALVWGVNGVQGGWVATVDLFSQPDSFCQPLPNSTGAIAGQHATGSASIAANDMTLWATDLPAGQRVGFLYGSGKVHAPFGDRRNCLTGTVYRFPLMRAHTGIVSQGVDFTGPAQIGGAATAGSTWHFQAMYQDGRKLYTTPGLTIDFVP
jgi:hypothetical protein